MRARLPLNGNSDGLQHRNAHGSHRCVRMHTHAQTHKHTHMHTHTCTHTYTHTNTECLPITDGCASPCGLTTAHGLVYDLSTITHKNKERDYQISTGLVSNALPAHLWFLFLFSLASSDG